MDKRSRIRAVCLEAIDRLVRLGDDPAVNDINLQVDEGVRELPHEGNIARRFEKNGTITLTIKVNGGAKDE